MNSAAPHDLRERILLDADWLMVPFDLTDKAGAKMYDGPWVKVNLPHDFVIDGQYARTNDEKHGYLPLHVAWYHKSLTLPTSFRGKILRLDFDGVARDSQVWCNGHYLGRHPSAFTPFSYDVTPWAKLGAENQIDVRVDPREFEGHWYEGGGIYRHVYLTVLAPLHVAPWGTYVTATVADGDQGGNETATLKVRTTVENVGEAPVNCSVVSEIIGPDGRAVQKLEAVADVAPKGRRSLAQEARVEHPRLWSLETPQLYTLRTTVLQDGRAVDSTTTTFGIRTIRFDADHGFFLNGRHVEIKGVANHQDVAGLGLAVPDSLQAWRVKTLKAMGCNGWRTAHNPPNEAVLDACDRLGMLVMDENRHLGDAYGSHSPPGTTATNLSDLAVMIQRDRNHPSVIMWSLCNEEGLRRKAEGKRLFAAMTAVVRQYDNSRPVTCAINGAWLTNGMKDEDIVGANYHYRDYDGFRAGNRDLPLFASETCNNKTTRGEYADDKERGFCSGYHLDDVPWLAVATRPYFAGAYLWTGFDYKGEPNPHGWPDVGNNTGLLDYCGFPKDKYYYFESCWSDRPMVHLLPSTWNWRGQEGKPIRVLAFSNARRVELFLNGRSLGAKEMPFNDYVEWEVPYEPGQLKAVGLDGQKEVARDILETTEAPARLVLSPDRTSLEAGSEDAVVVPVSVLDAKGRVVPDAGNRVTFNLAGDGTILGVGNGNPADHDPDKAFQRNAFHGYCAAVVEAGDQAGRLRLTASSPGLAPAEITFQVRRVGKN